MSEEELWDSWKHDYEPFGYVFIQEPKIARLIIHNNIAFQMKVCKNIKHLNEEDE
jgi:hypothetical protein